MTDETDRHVFDAYAERAIVTFTREELPDGCIVVSDDALASDNGSMPQAGEHVTVAGQMKAVRGKVDRIAYIVRPD